MIYKNIQEDIVSTVCYGGGNLRLPEHMTCILSAIDFGVNFFDTSENYYNGNSEIVLGSTLKDIRKKVFIGTKVGPENLSYNNLIKSCENSLSRLDTDYIDIYYIHWPNSAVPLDETCKALEQLLIDGKIRKIGICNFAYGQLLEIYSILGNKLSMLQYEYNILDRSIENEILPFSEENNIPLLAFSPLRFSHDMGYDNSFILSWIISHKNIIVATSSLNRNHIQSNTEIELINKKEIEKFPIDYIHTDLIDFNTNKNFSPVIDILAEDIKKYGALKPIKLIKENDRYKIIDGGLRFLSWKHAYPDRPIQALVLNREVPKSNERR